MLRYHLATSRWMASHLSVYSHQKGLSAIQRKIPSLITLLKITRTDWPRRLETRLNLPKEALPDGCEWTLVIQRADPKWYRPRSIANESMQRIVLRIPYFDFTLCISCCVSLRSGIKKVIQLLLQLRSMDKARLVAVEHNMDELVKDLWYLLRSFHARNCAVPRSRQQLRIRRWSFLAFFFQGHFSSELHGFHFDTYDQKCILCCTILVAAIMN